MEGGRGKTGEQEGVREGESGWVDEKGIYYYLVLYHLIV